MLYGQTQTIKLESGETLNGFKVAIPNPAKEAIIRLPTVDEATVYFVKVMDRAYGFTPKNKTDEIDRTPELELFNSIRLDQGEAFDEYEAEFIIVNIHAYNVTFSEKTPDGYKVTMKTPFGEVSHLLRLPTFKQIAQYKKASNDQKKQYSFNPTNILYDACVMSTEGYTPTFRTADIPPDHKLQCVMELNKAHDRIDPIQIDPNV